MSAATRTAIAALVLSVLPPGASAAGEAAYASVEQAFEAVFITSGVAQRGYDENREYAAALYQMPDGRWYATPVLAGGRVTSAIPYHLVPPDAIRIAGAHTHGQPTLPEDPSRIYGIDFSETDRRNAVLAYQASHGRIDCQILLNSRLEVLQLTVGPRYDAKSERLVIATRTAPLIEPVEHRVTQASRH